MKLVLGRAGSGKSYYCMNEIKENLLNEYDGSLIYIVPEQFSLTAEYDVSDVIGRGGILEVDVMSFKRLCYRIYNEFGYKSATISKSAKAMLVYSIMKDLEKELILLKGVDKKPGLVSTICDLISEFKRYNVTPEMLTNTDTKNERLSNKLKELSYIYAEYEKRIDGKFIDSDDDLRIVMNYLAQSKMLQGAKIWIDGFDGFTPQELEVIKALNKVADVTIAISNDEANSELFLLNKKTIEKLKKFTSLEMVYLDESKRFDNTELIHLEKNFNMFPPKKYDKETNYIDLSIMPNLYMEVERIACDISKKVRDEGYRYDNIMIASRNIQTYESIFKMIFERYNIPYFLDAKSDLSVQPLICLVMSLLDICSRNYQTDTIITYLKTGLSNIDDINDIDRIENYVLKYGIKGKKWLEEWSYDTDEVNAKINPIREQIINPIVDFKTTLAGKKTVRDITTALYEFLVKINVEENIKGLLEQIKEKENILSSDIMFANAYVQVWNIFVKLLDELVDTMGDENVSFDKYQSILKEGILTQQIGLIPTSKDEVIIGDIARSRNSHISVLYVVGVNDGLFPMQYNNEGFLSDNERNLLLENDIEIAKDTKMLLLEENFNIYKTLTVPKKELHISYPITDEEGTTLRPSSVINELKNIFPKLKESNYLIKDFAWDELINTKKSAFVHLADKARKEKDNEEIDERWKATYKWYQKNNPEFISLIESGLSFDNNVGRLDRKNATNLYGTTVKSSVSKMESYASCPFKFYLQYGLNVKERKLYRLETPDVGVFMHDILDKFSKHLDRNGIAWREIEREDLDAIASQIVDTTLAERKYNIFTSNNRLKFLSIKLKRIVKRVLWIITLHIKTSEFDVLGSEMTFGENGNYPSIEIELEEGNELVLNGKIDRMDIAKTEDGKYIRIIDYKSSAKSINLSKVYYGLQLQLITYLDVVTDVRLGDVHQKSNDELLPGGALYLKLDDPIIKSKKKLSPEEVEEQIREKLKMDGIILADVRLVKAMDTEMVKESKNLNLSVKKDGTYSKMQTATLDELKGLCNHTKKILKKFAEEILSGNVEIKPTRIKKETPCDYCAYKEICNFDRELGNRFKQISTMDNEAVFEQTKLF